MNLQTVEPFKLQLPDSDEEEEEPAPPPPVSHLSAKTYIDKIYLYFVQQGLPVEFLNQINDLKDCVARHSSKCKKQTKIDEFLR